MQPLRGVQLLQADFADEAVPAALDGTPVDLVMSDMAPNISGESAVDQPRAIYLAELALGFTGQVLRPGGDFLVKVFQGEGFDAYLRKLREQLRRGNIRKLKASR